MSLQTSSNSINPSPSTESSGAEDCTLDEQLLPGSCWRCRRRRKDKSRKVVVVVSRVGPLRVEVEDRATGERTLLMLRTLGNSYAHVAELQASIHPAPSRNESSRATGRSHELGKLGRALTEARVPGTKITTVEWEVTPALAAALLAHNPSNEAPSRAVVTAYAHALTYGRWRLSHQGLAVGPGMELGDGAHRCLAIVQSGVTIAMRITVYHSPIDFDEARPTWDCGQRRSKADMLEQWGLVPNGQGKHVCAVLGAIAYVDERFVSRPTNDELLAMYLHVKTSMDAVAELSAREYLAPTRAAFVIAHLKAPKEIEECIRLVSTKIGYQAGSAAHALVMKCPELQIKKGLCDRVGLVKDVLSLLYKHVKGERGVTNLRHHGTAYEFFLGEHLRELEGR